MSDFLSLTAAQARTLAGLIVENGLMQPVFSCQDAIREHALVESALDNGGDGKPGVVAAGIIRPKETEWGLELPVIMDFSPYCSTLGRGNESRLKKCD
ncbi:hypothetical protein ACWD6R_35975 [Streptomyces sp. NPDC005151]